MSILIFIGAILVHLLLHRTIRHPTVAVAPYPIGFILLIIAMRGSAYPLTAAVLYALLVAGYLLFFLSYLNDAESPSAKVLSVVRAHGPLGRRAILAHFTDEELIGKRIARLIRFGWVEKNGEKLVVTRHGALIAGMFAWYRRLLGWGEGG